MPLTVLTDSDVRQVLDTLTRDDVLEMHQSLADALHSFSTSTNNIGSCSANQPHRLQMKGKDGNTVLFMPAASDTEIGVKIVSLSESSGAGLPLASSRKTTSIATSLSKGSSSRSSSPKSSTPRSATPLSSSPRSATPTPQTSNSTSGSITRSPTASTTSSLPSIGQTSTPSGFPTMSPDMPVERPALSDTSPKGSITLLSATGQPRGFVNASTLTAFRTALVSTMLFKMRHSVHTVTVFGAGLQAYWHLHLALLLRGPDIHHLNIVNRSFPRAQHLLMSLAQHQAVGIPEKMRPSILTPEYGEYDRLLKDHVRSADVILCCTPATEPLFPAGHLTNLEGRRKARYVCAIGSYKPHMREIHEDVLRQAVQPPHTKHHHRHAAEGGAIVVDTIEGAMKEAGEVIAAGISGHGIVELGELVMLKRSHWAEKAERERAARERGDTGSVDGDGAAKQSNGHGLGHLFHHHSEKQDEGDGGLKQWLQKGNVIYKGVGIGLMDVVVGMHVVRLAEQRGIGTTLPDF